MRHGQESIWGQSWPVEHWGRFDPDHNPKDLWVLAMVSMLVGGILLPLLLYGLKVGFA